MSALTAFEIFTNSVQHGRTTLNFPPPSDTSGLKNVRKSPTLSRSAVYSYRIEMHLNHRSLAFLQSSYLIRKESLSTFAGDKASVEICVDTYVSPKLHGHRGAISLLRLTQYDSLIYIWFTKYLCFECITEEYTFRSLWGRSVTCKLSEAVSGHQQLPFRITI